MAQGASKSKIDRARNTFFRRLTQAANLAGFRHERIGRGADTRVVVYGHGGEEFCFGFSTSNDSTGCSWTQRWVQVIPSQAQPARTFTSWSWTGTPGNGSLKPFWDGIDANTPFIHCRLLLEAYRMDAAADKERAQKRAQRNDAMARGAVVNIGLDSAVGPVDTDTACREISRQGGRIVAWLTRQSDTGPTFVALLAEPLTEDAVNSICVALTQDAIAHYDNSAGIGHLWGPGAANLGGFKPCLFINPWRRS